MSERIDTPLLLATMRACFASRYERLARFREDAALVGELGQEAEPVLHALYTALAPPEAPRATHEAYALLNLLGRRAALLGATPSVPLAIADAIAEALSEVGVSVDPTQAEALTVIVVEGYCAARDERVTAALRTAAAEAQVAVTLAPGVSAVFLAGSHEERDLGRTLERLARELLHEDTQSCLLDVSRLAAEDEDVARAVGRFCAQAASLGVVLVVFGASALLRRRFARWLRGVQLLQFVDDYARAQGLALAVVGYEVKPRRSWTRLWLRGARSVVR